MEDRRKIKTFPLKLELGFNKKIDLAVLNSDNISKHQYILDAINEKIQRESNTKGAL